MSNKTKKYTIEVIEDSEKGTTINRENNGFNLMELLGILEYTQLDLIDRLKKDVKPDKIETKVVLDN